MIDRAIPECGAIVTGAAGGLGRAMTQGLSAAGIGVLLADIDGEAAREAADALTAEQGAAARGRLIPIACDITRAEDCERAVKTALEAFGKLDLLVNNAALGQVHIERSPRSTSFRFWEADREVWQRAIAVNVNGTFLMSHTAAPAMVARGWGRIVNITTSLDTMQRAENSPYGVSKAAIEAETLIWAQDLAGTGVTVNSLIPGGAADTAFVSDHSRASILARGRTLLPPKIMIPPLLWLASRASDGFTGRRFVARLWDEKLPPSEAAQHAIEAPVIRESDRRGG